jgi:hypothetical protein
VVKSSALSSTLYRIILRLSLALLSTGGLVCAGTTETSLDCGIDPKKEVLIPANKGNPTDVEKHAYRLTDGSLVFLGRLTVDADGAPKAYGPNGIGLDDLENAGTPGNWWALATDADDCGPTGKPLIQGPDEEAPGYYVSMTELVDPSVKDCRKQRNYTDSGSIPYVALPTSIASIKKDRGNLVVVEKTGTNRVNFAIHADRAPNGVGEGSIDLARRLGLSPDPRTGGTDARDFVFLVLKETMDFPRNAADIEKSTAEAFASWGGPVRLKSCEQALLLLPK